MNERVVGEFRFFQGQVGMVDVSAAWVRWWDWDNGRVRDHGPPEWWE